jgi:DNA (cytosine-5)-methyltransferase 1
MSWLYSQALVEEYLGDTSSDGEQSVQLSGNPTQQAYLSPDKMTEYSRLSRFGMMFKLLTENRGEELLMSYLAAFPAKTSLPQEKAQGLTESDQECGEKWRGSFTKYDPDSSLWKTHQCSLLGGLDEFSETWPRWGLMRDGECWEQQMLAHRTSETEFGLKPDNETFFHTPNTTGMDGGSNSRKALKKRMLPTPNARDWKDGKTAGNRKSPGLGVVVHWPTPRSCSAMAATITPESAWAENRFPNLETVVGRRMWPTPRTPSGGPDNSANKLRPSGHQGTTNLQGAVGGKLNPTWVEWLMGWPLGWADLKPLEMDKFQKWQEQHGRN